MIEHSAIYRGEVVHIRHRPKAHRFRYRVFSLLVDLDELPELSNRLRLFSHNRFSLFSIHDRDHGKLDGSNLRHWAEAHLKRAGIDLGGGRIAMLCYPRILGHVFNPLTVFYCYGETGSLIAILYEVCNTFHERFTYVIPVTAGDETVRQSIRKQFYVSPFIPMDCDYHFGLTRPGAAIAVRINETDDEGPLLYAAFQGKRRNVTDRELLRAMLAYPLMSAKIVASIHFEALRLLTKGLGIFRHEPAPAKVQHVIAGERRQERGNHVERDCVSNRKTEILAADDPDDRWTDHTRQFDAPL
ncbi:DUF1365 domain-containing protein [Martelella alba]|uniref:DUF1365 domain-containing protein n=1 Tax=Martelella alba TaxID=2590451 RepID=A0A506UIV7_9HYPH|nr:DUF1365 domain-containing protein [Martelella alba]TPW33264.1 DUF1365 domain-containing protein [Martelella alba]